MVTAPADWTRGDAHGDLSAVAFRLCAIMAAEPVRRYATEDEALEGLASRAIAAAVGVTPSQERARRYGIVFTQPFLRDELRLLVRASSGIASLSALAGRTVCFITGEAAEVQVPGAARRARIPVIPSPFEEEGEMEAALAGGRCAAVADTQSRLAGIERRLASTTLLPDVLGAIPAAIAVRPGPWEGAAAHALASLADVPARPFSSP